MWQLLAPQYTASAVRRAPGLILDLIESFSKIPDEAVPFAKCMWELHHMLIAYSDNMVYGLIFNTFKDFYSQLASYYYRTSDHRNAARKLWAEITPRIEEQDTEKTAELVTAFVATTAEFWKDITFEQYQQEVLEDKKADKKTDKKKKKTK